MLPPENNIGVLHAQQKKWALAMASLGKAATVVDDNAVLDNMDQVWAMAEQDGVPASILADLDHAIRLAVAQLHAAGKHLGENRWGNTWVTEDVYQPRMKNNHLQLD